MIAKAEMWFVVLMRNTIVRLEVNLLVGDPSLAKKELNWEASTSLEELCTMMVESDLDKVTVGESF